MNLTRDRVRSIGWAFVLTVCCAATLALTFRVNAVKSQVRLAERQIVSLRQEKIFLETEFETRSNQQQLRALNDVEFGYEAPTARQYLEGERQLASLGKPRSPEAPDPIRVASAALVVDGNDHPALVSPISGKPMAFKAPAGEAKLDGSKVDGRKIAVAETLKERLARIEARSASAQ